MRDDQPDVAGALLKVLGLAVGIGVAIGLVVLVVVKALGLGGSSSPAAQLSTTPQAPLSTLPTSALTPSGAASESESSVPTPRATSTTKGKKIQLDGSPGLVAPSERINLTGTYPGQDNIQLQVQRKDNGRWAPFADVTASVRVGSFATWVQTSRTGDNFFRVFDPLTQTASNPVTVTVQ